MSDIKLIALDLDGTLLNHDGKITDYTKAQLKRASEQGVHIVISTGRPLNGVPLDQLDGLGVDYAITTNGAAIYRISTGELLFENGMDFSLAGPVLEYLLTKDIHISVYVDGEGFATPKCLADLDRTDVHQSLKDYILDTRTPVEDLYGYVKASGKKVEKITLHFYPQPDGVRLHREEVGEYLYAIPEIETVCGGFHNFEFSKLGINKGIGLRMLAEHLGLSPFNFHIIYISKNITIHTVCFSFKKITHGFRLNICNFGGFLPIFKFCFIAIIIITIKRF